MKEQKKYDNKPEFATDLDKLYADIEALYLLRLDYQEKYESQHLEGMAGALVRIDQQLKRSLARAADLEMKQKLNAYG